MRQGGDPRLPLELALVKVTRPHADLSRESLAHRVELLEARPHAGSAAEARAPSPVPAPAAGPAPDQSETQPPNEPSPADVSELPALKLEQLQEAWSRGVIPAVRERGAIPLATLLGEARPAALDGDTITLEFARAAEFHRRQVEEQKNIALVRDALYEVTGRRLGVATVLAAGGHSEPEEPDEPLSEENLISLLKDTFDATEVEETT
jgi:hypothetical protein